MILTRYGWRVGAGPSSSMAFRTNSPASNAGGLGPLLIKHFPKSLKQAALARIPLAPETQLLSSSLQAICWRNEKDSISFTTTKGGTLGMSTDISTWQTHHEGRGGRDEYWHAVIDKFTTKGGTVGMSTDMQHLTNSPRREGRWGWVLPCSFYSP